MIGLRWWSSSDVAESTQDAFDDENPEEWFFESPDKYYVNTTFDNHIFWWGLVFSELFWAFVMIIGVLSMSFFWSILTIIGFS